MQRVLVAQMPGVVEDVVCASTAGQQPQSAEDIFTLYSRYVLQIAYRMLGRQSDAEDIAQDVFALAIVKLDKVLASRSPRVWLASATVRCCLHALRRRRVRQRFGYEGPLDLETVASRLTSNRDIELVTRTLYALSLLSDELRVVWTLRHVEGESMEDLATIMGQSLSTAKRRLARAERELKNRVGHD